SHPDFAQSQLGLAMVYQAMGRLDEAEPLFRRAVETHEEALGADNPATLRCRHTQALFFQARGDFRRAGGELAHVRDRLGALLGDGAPALAAVLGDLARLYGSVGDHLAAQPLWRRVREINLASFPNDAMMHAQDLVNLAMLHRNQGEIEEAEESARESVRLV